MLGEEIYRVLMADADFLSGQLSAPKFFKLSGECVMIVNVDGRQLYYTSCPECRKKVLEEEGGGFRCEACDKVHPECDYGYNFTARIGDFSNAFYV